MIIQKYWNKSLQLGYKHCYLR